MRKENFMRLFKKRTTLLWYMLQYLLISLAIPMSFLILVDYLGKNIDPDFVIRIFFLLFLVSFVIFCVLMMMSILEIKNLVVTAIDKLREEDYTTRIRITDDMPEEIVHILQGFNAMMENTEQLVHQTRSAVLEQKNAQIAALEAQIDPHFLYNTLDTINWKAIEHEDYEVSNMVGALADILRFAIKNPNEECSLEQEIYWLNQYMLFQKAKIGKELKTIYDVPEELQSYKIHKLILQPFVENSIKHGFSKVDRPCVLKIKVRDAREQLHITVKDNGIGMAKDLVDSYNHQNYEQSEHLGIANVSKRLLLYYGDDANLFFESEADVFTRVHLFIPKRNRMNDNEYSDCGR